MARDSSSASLRVPWRLKLAGKLGEGCAVLAKFGLSCSSGSSSYSLATKRSGTGPVSFNVSAACSSLEREWASFILFRALSYEMAESDSSSSFTFLVMG